MTKQQHLITALVSITTALVTFLSQAMASECYVNSEKNQVALLEVYTSEGCSSCPPADKWLSGIAARGYTSDRLIPLSLHVDYWDYIGWKDTFAKPAFAERQKTQATLTHSIAVYTPQVMLNGQDFRGWSSESRLSSAVSSINQQASRANIHLTLNSPIVDSFDVNASIQTAQQKNAVLYIALYENALTSQVNAGENNGEQLHHDYVVREWFGPFPINEQGNLTRTQKIKIQPGWKTTNMGVTAFVQNSKNGEVLQATTTKLCK